MAIEAGRLNPDQLRLVWQTTQKLLQSGLLHDRRPARQVPLETFRVWIKNESGETIPPYACMEITGSTNFEGRFCVTVGKPQTRCGQYLFNSQYEIDDGGGWAYAHGVIKMKGSGSFDGCKRFRPIPDSWSIEKGPGPFVCFGEGGSDGENNYVWGRIVGDYCQARYILANYSKDTGQTEISEFWEGNDPRDCGTPNITYPMGQPLCDSQVFAIWNSNDDEYKVVATPSATLGEPVTQQVVRDVGAAECGISVGKTSYFLFPSDDECEGPTETATVDLGSPIPVVIALSSDECGVINYAYQTINAFLCSGGPQFTSFAIDFGNISYVSEISFGPPECDGAATWTWSVAESAWSLTTPCSAGCTTDPPDFDGDFDGDTAEIQCFGDQAQTNCGLRITKLPLGGVNGACAEGTGTGEGGGGTTTHVPINLEAQEVLTGVALEADTLTFSKAVVYVCAATGSGSVTIGTYECPPDGSGEESGTGETETGEGSG